MKPNKFLQGIIGLLAVALIIYVGVKARNAMLEYNYIGKTGRDTITISGEGKVKATPDVAQVSLGVQTDSATVKEAQKQNTQKMNAILDAMKALGVDKKDLQTTNYSIYPKIDWRDGKQNIIGYSVSQSVTVKIRDLDKIGDVLAKAGELGANQVGGVQFTIDDPKKLQEEARTKAIDDARKKAEELAKQLGLTVARVVSFSESAGGYPPPVYKSYDALALSAREAAPSPTIEPGQEEVVSSVSVTFEVR